jgi:hypothetical protein
VCLQLGACGMPLRKNGEVNPVTLTRVFAPVDRYDCAGTLVSSKTEEVSPASQWIRIESDSWTHSLDFADVRNLSLRPDNNSGLLSLSASSVSFLIEKSDAWLSYQVKDGMNEFAYKFYERDTATDLPAKTPYEEGSVLIDVTYRERHETQRRTYRPSAEECTPPGDGSSGT